MKLLGILIGLALFGWLVWSGPALWEPVLEHLKIRDASEHVSSKGSELISVDSLTGMIARRPAEPSKGRTPAEMPLAARPIAESNGGSALDRLLRFEELPEAPPVEVIIIVPEEPRKEQPTGGLKGE